MIWLLKLPIPPALLVVFAGITLPAALVAGAIGVHLVRVKPVRVSRRVLGILLILYGLGDVLTLVFFLLVWRGDLLPPPAAPAG